MIKRGLFITFEGGEGTGKTTQIQRLLKALIKDGFDVVQTKEPGGTPLGQELRRLLLDSRNQFHSKYTEILFFTADRLEHIAQKIEPALQAGKIVLCDRFIDSTLAYQEAGQKIDPKTVDYLCSLVKLTPDLTFLLDIDPKIGVPRAKKRHVKKEELDESKYNRFEHKDLVFHESVRENYLMQAKRHPNRIKTINVDTLSIEEVFDRLYPMINAKLFT